MQARLNALYDDTRFSGVGMQTKTDIINTIGIELDEDTEKKFTKAQLQEALHYLLAKTAVTKPEIKRLFIHDTQSFSSYRGDPFYFGYHDNFWLYLAASDLSNHHHHHRSSSFFGGGGGGDSSRDCKEGAAILVAIACVCAAGLCCVYCTAKAYESAESEPVKNIKVGTATVAGLLTFILLTYYLFEKDVLKSKMEDDYDFSPAAYRFIIVLLAAVGAFLAAGTVSTLNRYLPCLPKKPEFPGLSPEGELALLELSTIQILLEKGWHHEFDNVAQSDALIREVIKIYIDHLSLDATLEASNDVHIEVMEEKEDEEEERQSRRLMR
jgi:hypothetical protein